MERLRRFACCGIFPKADESDSALPRDVDDAGEAEAEEGADVGGSRQNGSPRGCGSFPSTHGGVLEFMTRKDEGSLRPTATARR